MRNTFPREFHIPKGATKIADKRSDVVAYSFTNAAGQPCALAFIGKSQKPAWRYRFSTAAKRDQAITDQFTARQVVLGRKNADRAKAKAFVNPYKVGDLFGRSWGYDQTNVNYYEVVQVRGKYLWVREIAQEYVASGDMCGNTTPLPGKYLAREPEKKCLAQDGRIKINHYAWAYYKPGRMIGGVKVYGTEYTSSYA